MTPNKVIGILTVTPNKVIGDLFILTCILYGMHHAGPLYPTGCICHHKDCIGGALLFPYFPIIIH